MRGRQRVERLANAIAVERFGQVREEIVLLRRRKPVAIDLTCRARPPTQVSGVLQERVREPEVELGHARVFERRPEERLIGFQTLRHESGHAIAGHVETVQLRVAKRLEQRIELRRWIVTINPCGHVTAPLVEFLLERPELLAMRGGFDPWRRLRGEAPHGVRVLLTIDVTARPGKSGGNENTEDTEELSSSSRGESSHMR